MKKLLSIFTTLTIVSGASTGVVSCGNDLNDKKVIENFFVLGDSSSDAGAFAGIVNQIIKNNNWSDDSSILGVKLKNQNLNIELNPSQFNQNRFSNGIVAADEIANKIGVKLSPGWDYNINLPGISQIPYNFIFNDCKIDLHVQQKGNDYAFAYAHSLPLPDQNNPFNLFINNFSLRMQMQALFNQHLNNGKLPPHSAIMVEIGGDDFLDLIGDYVTFDYDTAYNLITKILNSLMETINSLQNAGAQDIVVTNLPNFRLLPRFNKLSEYNQQLLERLLGDYNTLLKNNINKLQKAWPNVKLFDLYSWISNLIKDEPDKNNSDPAYHQLWDEKSLLDLDKKYVSFSNKTGRITVSGVLNKSAGASIDNVDNFLFLDGEHVTNWVHKILGDAIYNLMINKSN